MFDQDKYLKAINFAQKAYENHENKESMITYLSSVAMEVIHATIESKFDQRDANIAITCALLHNIFDNTSVSFDEVLEEFDEDISNGVEALSNNKQMNAKDQLGDSVNKLLGESYNVQIVKIASTIISLQKPKENSDSLEIFNKHKEARFILSCFKNANMYIAKRLEEKIALYRTYIK